MHPIQRKIFNLCVADNLGPLTLRRLGDLIGVINPQQVKHHIERLEDQGFIKYDKTTKTITLLKRHTPETNLITVPLMGGANCGEAKAFADNYAESHIKVSSALLNHSATNIFALEAIGDSMDQSDIKGKNIEDGDYVLVDSNVQVPNNGDYVVSIIEGMANIKKFYRDAKNNQIVLVSESSKKYPPIFIDINEIENYLVSGKVVQVIKKPSF
jgi:SOS-response transcriptional repressor LexA